MTTGTPPPDSATDLGRQGFRVGDWDVHPLQGVIEQGGHRVHVEPKVMDVLVCLARHPGQVVTRDMLLAEVWKGVVVTDDVVTRCISELRTVLRDTGRDRRFIRTIPKRGYSLLVPVEALAGNGAGHSLAEVTAVPTTAEAPAPVPDTPHRRVIDDATRLARRAAATTGNLIRATLLGLGLLIVTLIGVIWAFSGDDGVKMTLINDDDGPAADGRAAPVAARPVIRSVAVLPLVNLSGNPEHEYFSDGLAEDIRNALVGVTDLRVAARTSSVAFRDRPMDAREIARQLNVEALLEGTVRIDNARLRVTTQLTDGRTGYPIWASSFERPVTDKLSLQAEVAKAIIGQLAPSFSPGDPLLAGATGNEQAHDAYLLGRYYWNQRTQEGLERSVGYFETALARDPGYALAYSGLADAWSILLDNGYRSRADAAPKARQNAVRALELNPGLAEAHASMGMVLKEDGDLRGALLEYQKAVDLEPGYSMGQMWLGILWLGMGDANVAASHLKAALDLDPLHPAIQVNYLSSLIVRGELDRAREEALRLFTLAPGEKLRKMLWQVSLELGNYDDVLAQAVSQAGAGDATPFLNDAVIEALIYLQRLDEAALLIGENGATMPAKRRLALESSLAVARRDGPTLRRVAAELVAPETLAGITRPYQGCIRQWSTLWLGIADLLDGQPATAVRRFQSVARSTQPVICEEDTPALRAVAMAYALASQAELGAPDLGQEAEIARAELAKLRALGWNDASFAMAEIAIAVLGGDDERAATLLRDVRRRGLQPWGRMRASPLFDELLDRPPLRAVQAELAAEFETTRKRAAAVQLAKLGI